MKRFKYVLPILAVMIAVVGAFAFKSVNEYAAPKTSAFATIWLKYDCSTGQPDLHGTTNVFTSNITAACTGTSGTICVQRYADLSNLEPIPGRPGFYRPKSVNPVAPEATFYCPE